MKIVGLTGNLGSGKSTVAAMFRELGAATLDADQLARAAIAPSAPGFAAVVQRFGEGVLAADGTIDRAALADQVFRDPQARLDLEAIVHPHVFAAIGEAIQHHAATRTPLLVIEIPLLFEVEMPPIFDATVCVTAPREAMIARVASRSGYDRAVAEAILAAQMPPDEKARRADHVIENGGDLAATRRQVTEIFHRLISAVN
jgi:dephospho-CoA kinase